MDYGTMVRAKRIAQYGHNSCNLPPNFHLYSRLHHVNHVMYEEKLCFVEKSCRKSLVYISFKMFDGSMVGAMLKRHTTYEY